MNSISLIKSLFKENRYHDLINLIESDPNTNFESNFTFEMSIIFYFYIRASLELGIVDKSILLAENRYNSQLQIIDPEAKLYTIITYAYALMNKGLFQAITNLEVEGNEICNILVKETHPKIEFMELKALFKNIIGNGYLLISHLEKALQYYYECLEIREQLGNQSYIADSLLNIGLAHFIKGNYSQAYEFESRALNLYKKEGNMFGVLNTSVNIAILETSRGKWNEATTIISETLELAKSSNNLKFTAVLYQMQGDIYENIGNLDEAIRYYDFSLKNKIQLGNQKMIADDLMSIGHVHIEKKEYYLALDCFTKNNEHYAVSGSMFHLINSAFWIYWIHFSLGNQEKINFYFSQLKQYTASYRDQRTVQIFTITTFLQESFSNNLILVDSHAAIIHDMLQKNRFVDLKLQNIATNLLCLYKLNKLKSEDTETLRNEIDHLIESLYALGLEKKSYKIMVNSYILKAKFNLIIGNIEYSLSAIEFAFSLAKKYELVRFLDEIKEEERNINEKIEIWYKGIPINPPIAEKIDNSNILDYLKDIMNML